MRNEITNDRALNAYLRNAELDITFARHADNSKSKLKYLASAIESMASALRTLKEMNYAKQT